MTEVGIRHRQPVEERENIAAREVAARRWHDDRDKMPMSFDLDALARRDTRQQVGELATRFSGG